MKAIVVKEPHAVTWQDVPKPTVGPDDVLMRVCYAGICGTDIDIVKGEIDLVKEGRIQYPIRIGHEWSGVVEEIGENVKDLKIGDHVVSETFVSCNQCDDCKAGHYERCRHFRSVGTIDNPWPGAFAEYMCVPWYNVYKIPEGVALQDAALAEPASIAYCAINAGKIEENDSVLIIGTGTIGLAAVGILRCRGVKNIIVAGRRDQKLAIATDLGATAVINVKTENLQERIAELTGGKGVDAVLESSGVTSCVEDALSVAADGSRIILYSFYTQNLNDFPIGRLSSHNISLLGVPIIGGTQRELLRWMAEGKLDLHPLITHCLPFEEADDIITNFDRYGSSRIKIILERKEAL